MGMSIIVGEGSSRATLPWETKASISAFSLLALQQVHDGVRFCLGMHGLGLGTLQSAWVLLLLLYVSLAIGLAKEQRWAWRFSVILVGGLAALHLRDTLDLIRLRLQGELLPSAQGANEFSIVCLTTMRPDPFGAAWLMSQNGLMMAIPILLLLGHLRQRLIGVHPNLKPPTP